MNRFFLLIIICRLMASCSDKVDFSNPKSVIEQYYKLKGELNTEKEYELIADTCKDFATLHDYKNYYKYLDTIEASDFFILRIDQLPIDPIFLKYRRFEIQYLLINKESNDSTIHIAYETVFNEKGNWKIIWTKNLNEAASKLINSQKIEEGLQIYDQILKYDPLNGNAFRQLGWTQYRQNYYEAAIINAKKAIELNPKDAANYNLLAGIYSAKNNVEIAIENYKKAIELSLTESGKVYLLSNLSITYMDLSKYKEANIVLTKALSIDSNFTHAWWSKGLLHAKENNLDSAIECFKKATSLEAMGNFLQCQLFYSLANSEYIQATTKELVKVNRASLLFDAKEQIVRALDIQPDNRQYGNLLDNINRALLQFGEEG
jgi:tetratricopeptide (TPR) repeat protein